MLFECLQCRRQAGDKPEEGISHGYCVRCYLLFPECNGGINWKTATPEQRQELKDDIRNVAERDKKLTGEPKIEWPAEGLAFADSIIKEIEQEREARDGSHR